MLVDVAIPRTKFDFLTYKADDGSVSSGDLVMVPLRNNYRQGIVVATNSTRIVSGLRALKGIIERNFISEKTMELYKWIAEYYLGKLGEVLSLALPSKVLVQKKLDIEENEGKIAVHIRTPTPTYQQNFAIERIIAGLKKQVYKTFLLWGITGSGKTEVYMQAVNEVIENQGRALLLAPEISMTPLLLQRFSERFGSGVVTIHSSLNDKERRTIWHAIRAGKYRVVIGPRSAIFLPVPDLKLIIVDEEHDNSYKEHQRAVKYNGRDVAVMRGKMENIVVVLGSATPQLESYYNALKGKYELLTLKDRIDNHPLPRIEIIDLKKEEKKHLSENLERKIAEVLARKEQAILYLNRRGFAPSLICPNCGFLAVCRYCKLPMVYHKSQKASGPAYLSCHVCDHRTKPVSLCPRCGRATLLYKGAGTQRVEEIVRKMVAKTMQENEKKEPVVVMRMDRDSVRKKGEANRIMHLLERGDSQILIGTQLVTKGFDFPEVTLVGIINADTILNLPDFRSGERTFQVLTQVAGRAGRGSKPGTVIIQTYHPEQYAILFSQVQNYPAFYENEIILRKELNFPPFSKLFLIRVKGKDEDVVWKEARSVTTRVSRVPGLEVYGPNRSYYYRIRNEYRVFTVLKSDLNFQRKKLHFLKEMKIANHGARMEIDVDPVEIF